MRLVLNMKTIFATRGEKVVADKTKTTKSLDAHALVANGEANRDTLATLINEAVEAIEMARVVIEAETPRLLDIENDDPDQSLQLIESSKLRIDRLAAAIPRLQQRVDQLDLTAKQTSWNGEADALRGEADDLYWELDQVYPSIVDQLNELFSKARANAAAFHDLLRRAPPGVDRGFSEAMPYSDFWLRLALPSWTDPNITYPLRTKPPDPLVDIALQSAAQAKAVDAKMALMNGPGWFEAKRLEDERLRVESAKRDEEMKLKAEAERQEYYRALQEEDRRRRGVA